MNRAERRIQQKNFQKGLSYHQSGQLDKAILWYKKALKKNPTNFMALSNLGTVFQTLGKLDEAIASYQQAISIKPDYVTAYNNLGVAQKEQGKLDLAHG
jgi:tetratricopeptide (TPR) repeat protein